MTDPMLFPNTDESNKPPDGVSRRRLMTGTATAGMVAAAGCVGTDESTAEPTVFVFNTGDGTVSLIDPAADEIIETRAIGLSSSFPSNQYTPSLTDDLSDSLWLNVGRGVRGLSLDGFSETATVETGSGANWLEQTPDGQHVVVSAREPTHKQFRIDADPSSDTFGEVNGEINRVPEGGRGDNAGPGPCDITVHPDGQYAYVPDLYGDTLTVLSIDPFEIETQIAVDPVDGGPSAPWMGTVSWDGDTLLVEHNEGETGTESIWDVSDPTNPTLSARLTADDGLGGRPLTSEIGPDSTTGYVFTPGTDNVTVVDLEAGTVTDHLDLGGSAFVGTWNPARTKLYVPVQTSDEVAVIDHEERAIVDRLSVGPSPYGATASTVRPSSDTLAELGTAMAQLGIWTESTETTYCIGKCACGHKL